MVAELQPTAYGVRSNFSEEAERIAKIALGAAQKPTTDAITSWLTTCIAGTFLSDRLTATDRLITVAGNLLNFGRLNCSNVPGISAASESSDCLLYTSDAADE